MVTSPYEWKILERDDKLKKQTNNATENYFSNHKPKLELVFHIINSPLVIYQIENFDSILNVFVIQVRWVMIIILSYIILGYMYAYKDS